MQKRETGRRALTISLQSRSILALQGKEAGPAVWPQVPRREAHRRCGMVGHCFCKVVISTPRTPAHQLLLALKLTLQLGGLGVTTSASVTFSAHL